MGAGLEVLALRRGYRGRRRGSLEDLAEAVYHLIRSGEANLTKMLNLHRVGQLEEFARPRKELIEQRKQAAEADLMRRIDVRNIDPATLVTGYVVSLADLVEDNRVVLTVKPATGGGQAGAEDACDPYAED